MTTFAGTGLPASTDGYLALDEHWSAQNYHPLPVVIAEAAGATVTDVDGKSYLDFLSGYSALNFGHRHPDLITAVTEQLGRSRSPRGRSTTTSSACSAASWRS